MVAVYSGIEYKYISDRRSKEIITQQVTKTDSTFCKDKGIYYKFVNEVDLTDIYSVEFFVFFDSHLEGVPTWWKVTNADLIDDKIKIRFALGILPNWDVEEKNVCTRLVNFEDISNAKVKYTFRKKDGKDVKLLVQEEKMKLVNLLKKIDEYSESNL